jgi:hypothetical protein
MIARECYEMAAWLSCLIVAGVVLATTRPALADDPNFADLLARAEAQASRHGTGNSLPRLSRASDFLRDLRGIVL